MTAFPLLTQRAAASTVTLGRLSKIMKMTPSGTRTWRTSSPFGRRLAVTASPMGSGRAATSLRLWAMSSIRLSLKVKRSIAAAPRPAVLASEMSRALAARISVRRSRSDAAELRSHVLRVWPVVTASARDAALAASAMARDGLGSARAYGSGIGLNSVCALMCESPNPSRQSRRGSRQPSARRRGRGRFGRIDGRRRARPRRWPRRGRKQACR
jgi:hypothetical protein